MSLTDISARRARVEQAIERDSVEQGFIEQGFIRSDALSDAPAVYIDFKNPKAYLALPPTFALEDELGIAFDWCPVPVSAMSRPQPERPDEDRGTRHRRIRAHYYERDLRRYASVYGIELGDLYRNPDVAAASIGLLWVKERAPRSLRAYIDAVFARYWAQKLALDDARAIEALIGEIGVDTSGFQAYATRGGAHVVRAHCRGAARSGYLRCARIRGRARDLLRAPAFADGALVAYRQGRRTADLGRHVL